MHFPNPFPVGNFIKQPFYMSPDMCVLGPLNLTVWYFGAHLCSDLTTE